MLSTFIRVAVALSSAAILCSCGGNSVAETQQSTPEGLFSGTYAVTMTQSSSANKVTCAHNVLTFVEASGTVYTFYPSAADPAVVTTADQGSLSFSGGVMASANTLELNLPGSATLGCPGAITPSGVYSYAMNGTYVVGSNLTETLIYPSADANGWTNSTTTLNNATPPVTTMVYDIDYQGVQNLATLAGTYTGMVGTSQKKEAATFTISPPSVPANGGNALGVSLLAGTGASGCAYTGSVSPLYKGNGYTVLITSGPSPCLLPNQQFSGLMYLNAKTNILYSFAPNQARTDGVIFSGTRS